MKKLSLFTISLIQAFGLIVYVSLIGLLLWKSNDLFGPSDSIAAPIVFLLLFLLSAVITSLMFLGYPFILFWEHKQLKSAA